MLTSEEQTEMKTHLEALDEAIKAAEERSQYLQWEKGIVQKAYTLRCESTRHVDNGGKCKHCGEFLG